MPPGFARRPGGCRRDPDDVDTLALALTLRWPVSDLQGLVQIQSMNQGPVKFGGSRVPELSDITG